MINTEPVVPPIADERNCCGGCRFVFPAAANVVFVLAQIAWVGGTAVVLFLGIQLTLGLRINNATEEVMSQVPPFPCFSLGTKPSLRKT